MLKQVHSPQQHSRAAVQALGQTLQAHLEAKRTEIYSEIRHYPPPIPACDQQFNYLLAQRAQVAQALQQVAALRKQTLPPAETFAALQSFIHASPFIDVASAQAMLAPFTANRVAA